MPNGRQSPGRGQPGAAARELPKPQPVKYFEADGKTLRAALLDAEAEQWAQKLQRVKPSQLRRFYDHVLSIERRLKLESGGGSQATAAFNRLKPELMMLKAKAAYAQGRGTITKPLLEFVLNHTASVKSVEDFQAFRLHFEAVVAFHGYYGEKE
jgi:CRISPR-associated protein Csm2